MRGGGFVCLTVSSRRLSPVNPVSLTTRCKQVDTQTGTIFFLYFPALPASMVMMLNEHFDVSFLLTEHGVRSQCVRENE